MDTREKHIREIVASDGTPMSVMERPEGLGTIEEYFKKIQKYREQYADLFDRQSFDDFLMERKEEATRE